MDLRIALRRLAQTFAVALGDRLEPHDPTLERRTGAKLAHAASATNTHFARVAVNGYGPSGACSGP